MLLVTFKNNLTNLISLAHHQTMVSATSDLRPDGNFGDFGLATNPGTPLILGWAARDLQYSTWACSPLVPSRDFHYSTEQHLMHFTNGTAVPSTETCANCPHTALFPFDITTDALSLLVSISFWTSLFSIGMYIQLQINGNAFNNTWK